MRDKMDAIREAKRPRLCDELRKEKRVLDAMIEDTMHQQKKVDKIEAELRGCDQLELIDCEP